MVGKQWHFSAYNFYVCFLVSLGQIAFGYPASIIGVTSAQPPYLIYMGLMDPETLEYTPNADSLIGATSGIFQAGAFFNVFIASWVCDRWGRKAGLLWCAFLSVVGGAVMTGSTNITMFIVARFFAGGGSWGFLSVTPAYSAELAPPDLRGLMVGLNGINIAVGYGLASYMGLAFFYANDPVAQWRTPLGIALAWPIMMIVVCFLVPESPRFLLMQGRVDEAKAITLRLHRLKGDANDDFANFEFYQMAQQAEIDRKLDPSWLELFRRPSYRKRCILAMTFAFIGQSSGVLVWNNFGPTVYADLGYDTEYQLIFQAGWISVGIVFNAVGALLMDWTGRRPLLLIGVGGCCISLILEAAMSAAFADTNSGNVAGLRAGVAFAYLFLAFYSVGIDVAGVVFYSELFPNHVRTKGIALSVATIALTSLVYLQVAQTAFEKIGWKYWLVFIIVTFLGTIWTYFFIPETKGIPLEEMAALFGDGDDVAVYAAGSHLRTGGDLMTVVEEGRAATTEPSATPNSGSSDQDKTDAKGTAKHAE